MEIPTHRSGLSRGHRLFHMSDEDVCYFLSSYIDAGFVLRHTGNLISLTTDAQMIHLEPGCNSKRLLNAMLTVTCGLVF